MPNCATLGVAKICVIVEDTPQGCVMCDISEVDNQGDDCLSRSKDKIKVNLFVEGDELMKHDHSFAMQQCHGDRHGELSLLEESISHETAKNQGHKTCLTISKSQFQEINQEEDIIYTTLILVTLSCTKWKLAGALSAITKMRAHSSVKSKMLFPVDH